MRYDNRTKLRERPGNVGSMLGHRLRRWPNIEPAMGQCTVLSEDILAEQGLNIGSNQYLTLFL